MANVLYRGRTPGWLQSLFGALSLALLLNACGDLGTEPQILSRAPANAASYACNVMVGDTFVMCPISGGGGGDECDPWTSLNWCGGDCMMSTADPEFEGISGCLPTTPPGGGGTQPTCPGSDPTCNPPPDGSTEPGDTCRTGDPVIDSPDVYGQFDDLWQLSVAEGVEKGGWVVQGPGGYQLVPFQNATYGPCGINVYENPPAGTVTIVHTHPWPLMQTNPCGYLYTGTPSDPDREALKKVGASTGYFIDARGIGRFTVQGGETAVRVPRCGY